MRRILFITGFTLFGLSGFSQFLPITSQGFNFYSMYNPAFTGVDAFTDIRLGYRYQWAGLQGAPKSVNLAINTRLKQPLDLTSNALRASNPDGINIPNGKLSAHGLGVNVFTLSYGQVLTNGGGVQYAFNYPLSKNLRLAVGVGAVIEKTKIDLTNIVVRDPVNDQYYQQLLTTGASKTDISARAGLLLYSKSFFLGLSYLSLFHTSLQSPESLTYTPFYRASAQFGFSFLVSPTFYLRPSVLAILQTNNAVSIDYNVKAFVGDRIFVGISYRDIKAGVGVVGFNINEMFTVSYSYEMSLGKFKTYNDGSHEIALAVRLKNFRQQPAYAW
jgi:type IX secretion system PorP/SprF family membrane protein